MARRSTMVLRDNIEHGICSLCGGPYDRYGHNPQPVKDDVDARCCDVCNATVVIPARLQAAGLLPRLRQQAKKD
jgi:hypothetical protein